MFQHAQFCCCSAHTCQTEQCCHCHTGGHVALRCWAACPDQDFPGWCDRLYIWGLLLPHHQEPLQGVGLQTACRECNFCGPIVTLFWLYPQYHTCYLCSLWSNYCLLDLIPLPRSSSSSSETKLVDVFPIVLENKIVQYCKCWGNLCLDPHVEVAGTQEDCPPILYNAKDTPLHFEQKNARGWRVLLYLQA